MKIQSSKKTLIVVLAVLLVLFIIVFVILVKAPFGKNYPEEPLTAKSLGITNQNIDISGVSTESNLSDIPVYSVERKVHISLVEDMLSDLELILKRTDLVQDTYVEWSDENNKFTYDSLTDTLDFIIKEKLNIQRGEDAFTSIYSKYLDREYEFVINSEKKNSDGGVTYYASRLQDNIPIENGYGYEYTDILSFDKEGNLTSGKLFLAEITKNELEIPLIKDSLLKQYINSTRYPKESYLDTAVLQSTLNLDYLSDKWEDIEKTATDCKGIEKEVILLFKNTDQGYLLPVYKVDATCNVTYENNSYSVPATFYVNAVDPDYIVTD